MFILKVRLSPWLISAWQYSFHVHLILSLSCNIFKEYYYCCTHLSLHEEDRITSAAIIIDELSKLDKPAIIAGDFNALPNSFPMMALGRKFHIFEKMGSPYTFPANEPTREIDYIALYTGGGASAEVVSHEVLHAPVESDHAPIVAEVVISQQK